MCCRGEWVVYTLYFDYFCFLARLEVLIAVLINKASTDVINNLRMVFFLMLSALRWLVEFEPSYGPTYDQHCFPKWNNYYLGIMRRLFGQEKPPTQIYMIIIKAFYVCLSICEDFVPTYIPTMSECKSMYNLKPFFLLQTYLHAANLLFLWNGLSLFVISISTFLRTISYQTQIHDTCEMSFHHSTLLLIRAIPLVIGNSWMLMFSCKKLSRWKHVLTTSCALINSAPNIQAPKYLITTQHCKLQNVL